MSHHAISYVSPFDGSESELRSTRFLRVRRHSLLLKPKVASIIDDLATIPGVQAYLQDKPQFAAQTVDKLTGGSGNFVYRLNLVEAFDGRPTLVLKYAPPYIAASVRRLPLDQKRQRVEVEVLRLASRMTTPNVPEYIAVPTVHLFDEEKHVIIMEDARKDCRTLKEILIEEGIPKTVSKQIGAALAEYLCSIHTWNQNPDIDLTLFANHQTGKDISIYATYGRLESTLTGRDNIPTLSEPLLMIPESKMTVISNLAEKRKLAIQTATVSDPMTHGDFWPGNLVVVLKRGIDGTIEGVKKLFVLDWELSKTGLPGLDIGQFCAEMYTLSEFYPAREQSTLTIIGSFLETYRERRGTVGDIELAKTVAGHIGAHTVVWTPRADSWTGRTKIREVVEKGVELVVLGEEGTEVALKASIVGPLL